MRYVTISDRRAIDWMNEQHLNRPCPGCGAKGAKVSGNKATCATCSTVWNWLEPKLKART